MAHWTTEEKDQRDTKLESSRTFYECPVGHESSSISPLRRCPVAFCRSATLKVTKGPK